MPELYRNIVSEEGPEAGARDYVSGMTDHFAADIYRQIFEGIEPERRRSI